MTSFPPTSVESIDDIESVFVAREWEFAVQRRQDIDRHWNDLLVQKPLLYDGIVLLVDRCEILQRDGRRILSTRHFPTRYRNFLAWRDFGFPDASVRNCFAAAALMSADGAFVLGEMAAHTANAGRVYFAAGTPDMGDVSGNVVDLTGSILRELTEETGIGADEVICTDGWSVIFEGPRVGCMKIVRSALEAEPLIARVETFLASDENAELARMHLVRKASDMKPDAMPDFIVAYLQGLLERVSS
jgi:8-oxo-dGTP pyrophosphatase MutT (NUDIX family)